MSITDANNRFAAGLYREITHGSASGGGNIFFSPFSISSALALTYEGARGRTADEIRSVFYFPANDTSRREGFAAITAGINQGNTGYTLSTANALWAEKTSAFLPGYTSIAQQYYSANTTNLDFVGEPDASRQTINDWVAAKTNNKIQDLLPAGSISSLTRLVITNAVYFKGTWEKQFDANQTSDAPFTRPDGTTVTARMMQRTDEAAIYPYAETPDLQMLSLPYTVTSGQGLSMVVLLPKGNNLSAAAPYLDPAKLSALEQSASSRRVMVYLPKFKLESQYSLKDMLSSMGMPTAFSSAADFSGMDGAQDLYISDVYHKAYIEVNEEGTEAAAATGVVMNMMAVAPGSEATGTGLPGRSPVPLPDTGQQYRCNPLCGTGYGSHGVLNTLLIFSGRAVSSFSLNVTIRVPSSSYSNATSCSCGNPGILARGWPLFAIHEHIALRLIRIVSQKRSTTGRPGGTCRTAGRPASRTCSPGRPGAGRSRRERSHQPGRPSRTAGTRRTRAGRRVASAG